MECLYSEPPPSSVGLSAWRRQDLPSQKEASLEDANHTLALSSYGMQSSGSDTLQLDKASASSEKVGTNSIRVCYELI